jgi:hypothetical protein
MAICGLENPTFSLVTLKGEYSLAEVREMMDSAVIPNKVHVELFGAEIQYRLTGALALFRPMGW